MSKINTKIMSATPEAVKRLEHLINESEKDIKAIKIGVENGGCAGMAYTWIMLKILMLVEKL